MEVRLVGRRCEHHRLMSLKNVNTKMNLEDYERGLDQATSNPKVSCCTYWSTQRSQEANTLLAHQGSKSKMGRRFEHDPTCSTRFVGWKDAQRRGMDTLSRWVAQAQQVKDTQKIKPNM